VRKFVVGAVGGAGLGVEKVMEKGRRAGAEDEDVPAGFLSGWYLRAAAR